MSEQRIMKANARRPRHLDGRRAICRNLALHYNTWRAQRRLNAWRRRAAVIATTEAEVRAALAQPRPFYAELTQ